MVGQPKHNQARHVGTSRMHAPFFTQTLYDDVVDPTICVPKLYPSLVPHTTTGPRGHTSGGITLCVLITLTANHHDWPWWAQHQVVTSLFGFFVFVIALGTAICRSTPEASGTCLFVGRADLD